MVPNYFTTLTIEDDDVPEASISVNRTTIYEDPNAGATSAIVIVSLDIAAPVPGGVYVNVDVVSTGDGMDAGVSDYYYKTEEGSGVLVQEGETTASFVVSAVRDLVDEGDETIDFVLRRPGDNDSDYTVAPVQTVAIITIKNDDTSGRSSVPTDTITLVENSRYIYDLSLDTQPLGPVTVELSSSDTTALAVMPATLVFTTTDWNVPRTITLTAEADDDADSEEVRVSYAVTGYGSISSFPAQQVLVADTTSGAAAAITVEADRVVLMEEGESSVTLTATLSNAPDMEVALILTLTGGVTGGTAIASDYTIDPSQSVLMLDDSNTSGTVTVTAVDDDVAEAREELVFRLSAEDDSGNNIPVIPQELRLQVEDNDMVEIISSGGGAISLNEGEIQGYNLRLGSEPCNPASTACPPASSTTGSLDSLRLRLGTEPGANVTIVIQSSNARCDNCISWQHDFYH